MKLKSRFAYRETCNRLTELAQSQNSKLYFWTFTTTQVQPDWRATKIFSEFQTRVGKLYQYEVFPLTGIRVVERHKKGNLHWHCIVNKRIPIGEVWRLGKPIGIGRSSVKVISFQKGAFDYLAKYMEKDHHFKGNGIRVSQWATMGFFPTACRKNNVVIDSHASRFYARVKAEFFQEKRCPLWLIRDIYRSWHVGFPERDDWIMWHVRDKGGAYAAWDCLNWPDWYMAQEMGPLFDHPMDGRIPF